MIAVIVTLQVKEGKDSEFEGVMAALGEKVHANEPGCVQYDLVRHKKGGGRYAMFERYRDDAAFGAHSKTEYFKAAMPGMIGCLDGAPGIEIYETIE